MAFERNGQQQVGTSVTDPIVLKNNGAVNFVPRATAPTSPDIGDVYFDSTDNKLKCWDGTAWRALNQDSLLLE